MSRSLLVAILLALSSTAGAVVIRHDVEDSAYRIPASAFPALVDMPGEGHGVLIAPQWVITAAHTLPGQAPLRRVELGGQPRKVARVVVHEGYRSIPQELINQAMATGEAMLIVGFLASIDDIALIELAEPVADVVPVARHAADVRQGDIIRVVGKGATGNGETGYALGGPNRTELRHAYNEITSAYGRWFCYRLDDPSSALPLEGALGNGDSGGPALIEVGDASQLVGLAAWKVVQGHVLTARYGRYGEVGCNVRLGHYAEWIERVMTGHP